MRGTALYLLASDRSRLFNAYFHFCIHKVLLINRVPILFPKLYHRVSLGDPLLNTHVARNIIRVHNISRALLHLH